MVNIVTSKTRAFAELKLESPRLNRASPYARGLSASFWLGYAPIPIDITGHNRNVTVGGAPKLVIDSEKGRVHEFDRTANDYFRYAHAAHQVLGTSDFTIACSFRALDWGTANPAVFSKGTTGAGDWMVRDKQTSDAVLHIQLYGDAGGISTASTGTIADDTWHQVVFTRVGTTVYCYLNGVNVDSDTSAGDDLNTTDSLDIGGALGATTRAWNGKIEYAHLWNGRGLTDAEIARLYREPYSLLEASARTYFIPAAAGGSTFNKTALESLVLADTSAETAAFAVSLAESLVLADTSTEAAAFVAALTEALVLTDATTGSTGILAVIVESLVFADTAAEQAAFTAAIAETLSLADTGTTTQVMLRAVVEALVFSATASATGGSAEVSVTKGGQSMTLRQMRRLERQQLLAMIREDDDVILTLLAGILRNERKH